MCRAAPDELIDNFVRTHRELLEKRQPLAFRKQLIEFIWHDRLTPGEQERLDAAGDEQLNRLEFDYRRQATLIDAFKTQDTGTWQVGSCSRTRLLENAAGDLQVLRAWKNGQRLPGRISGKVLDRRSPPT